MMIEVPPRAASTWAGLSGDGAVTTQRPCRNGPFATGAAQSAACTSPACSGDEIAISRQASIRQRLEPVLQERRDLGLVQIEAMGAMSPSRGPPWWRKVAASHS